MKLFLITMLLPFFAHATDYVVWTNKTQTQDVERLGVKFSTKLRYFNGGVATLTETQVTALKNAGYSVEVNGTMRVMGQRSSNYSVTAETIPWGIMAVQAPKAHALAKGKGAGVVVCVIDTGIDASHPALAGQVIGGVGIAKSTVKGKEEWFDDVGHGTHVSGTIAGVSGVLLGVAPAAKLYAIKVLDVRGSGTYADVAEGIKACIGKGQVINMSLGGSSSSMIVKEAVEAAAKAGIKIACAAGNDGGVVGYPAKYAQCAAVSAVDSNSKIAGFSNRGKEIDFAAPGVDVKSSVPNGGYETWDGTSMATPHVAGVMAIAMSRGKKVLKAQSLKLKPTEQGAGRIDAFLTAK